MTLSSGATTGERCACGCPIYAYAIAGPYSPGEPVPLGALPWRWELICEAGHYQTVPASVP